MSEPICADCGQPITAEHYDLLCDGTARHELLRECVGALKSALSSAKSDRDRYRALLVALRDADRAFRSASAAASRVCQGVPAGVRVVAPAVDAERRAIDARRAAIAAAIAAVEEGR